MSRKEAIVQGTLAGLIFGFGVSLSNGADAIYKERLRAGESYTVKESIKSFTFEVSSIVLYATAGGLTIAGVGNVTRRREGEYRETTPRLTDRPAE